MEIGFHALHERLCRTRKALGRYAGGSQVGVAIIGPSVWELLCAENKRADNIAIETICQLPELSRLIKPLVERIWAIRNASVPWWPVCPY